MRTVSFSNLTEVVMVAGRLGQGIAAAGAAAVTATTTAGRASGREGDELGEATVGRGGEQRRDRRDVSGWCERTMAAGFMDGRAEGTR